MNAPLTLLALSVGLAMDATAAAAGMGAAGRAGRVAWQAGLAFGLSQSLMSALGALGGRWLATVAEAWDHWIAFALLLLVAAHMVWEARQDKEEARPSGFLRLLVLAVATSIDALAAGITLPLLELRLWVSLLVIGAVTAALSGVGALAGAWLAARMGPRLHDFGALVLVLIGLRIVAAHVYGV